MDEFGLISDFYKFKEYCYSFEVHLILEKGVSAPNELLLNQSDKTRIIYRTSIILAIEIEMVLKNRERFSDKLYLGNSFNIRPKTKDKLGKTISQLIRPWIMEEYKRLKDLKVYALSRRFGI